MFCEKEKAMTPVSCEKNWFVSQFGLELARLPNHELVLDSRFPTSVIDMVIVETTVARDGV